jgi:hypothetical protein
VEGPYLARKKTELQVQTNFNGIASELYSTNRGSIFELEIPNADITASLY